MSCTGTSSPSNVLLGQKGQVFLADFGIARSDQGDQTVTAPGQLTGTAAYVAPEQFESGESGPACDVYALGLVLLEALTGVRAFSGPVLEQALARLWRQPHIPLSLGAGWVRLLDAMTARDPAHRPDCASVTVLLRRLADPRPTAATALLPLVTRTVPQQISGPVRRRRRPVSRAAAAAIYVCVLVVGTAAAASSQGFAIPFAAPPASAMRTLAPGPVGTLVSTAQRRPSPIADRATDTYSSQNAHRRSPPSSRSGLDPTPVSRPASLPSPPVRGGFHGDARLRRHPACSDR